MNRIFGLALIAASLAVIPSASAQEQVNTASTSGMLVGTQLLLAETPIAITCKNPGSSQDVAKTPWLTNSTAAKIGAGKTVYFKSSDGDSGELKLAADLLPGASVKLMGGKAGQVYTCTGSFKSQADLLVSRAVRDMTTATIDIKNQNPWVDATAHTVRLDIINCSGNTLQKTVFSTLPNVPHAGGVRTVTIPVTSVGRVWFRVIADSEKMVSETNEANNIFMSSLNSCLY